PISIGASFPRTPDMIASPLARARQEASTCVPGRRTPQRCRTVWAMAVASEPEARVRRRPWRVIFRVLLLLATAVSLYLLFPSLVELFTQWRSLCELNPWWILLALVFEAASVTSLSGLPRD